MNYFEKCLKSLDKQMRECFEFYENNQPNKKQLNCEWSIWYDNGKGWITKCTLIALGAPENKDNNTFCQPVMPFIRPENDGNCCIVLKNQSNTDICMEAANFFAKKHTCVKIKPTPFENEWKEIYEYRDFNEYRECHVCHKPSDVEVDNTQEDAEENIQENTAKENSENETNLKIQSRNFKSWLQQGALAFKVDRIHEQLWKVYHLWISYFSSFDIWVQRNNNLEITKVPWAIWDMEFLYFRHEYRPEPSMLTSLVSLMYVPGLINDAFGGFHSHQVLSKILESDNQTQDTFTMIPDFKLHLEFKHKSDIGSGYLLHSFAVNLKSSSKFYTSQSYIEFSEKLKDWLWAFRCSLHLDEKSLEDRINEL